MVHPSIIEARLGELKFRVSKWFRAEVHELQHILMEHEKIVALACGRYFGSFALLVATDQRLLIIDKRVFFMNVEDTRYDMISEVDFNSQVYSASVTIHTLNKTHKFDSIKYKRQLRELTSYVQRRIMELRSQPSTVPMPDSVLSQLPSRPAPHPLQAQVQAMAPDLPQPSAPPIGTSYNYTARTTDDAVPALTEHNPDVAQMVGSAAMQAAHQWRRPVNPYLQGSLMSRGQISGPQYYQ